MAASKRIKIDVRSKLFDNIFDANSYDCRFQFVDGASNEVKEIGAHRKVLSALSPVFAAMFSGNWAENTSAVIIKDASFESFAALIKYSYRDTLDLTEENVADLLTLADRYDIPDLVTHSEAFMMQQLSADNVLRYWTVAVKLDRTILKKKCKRLFVDKPVDILQSDSFTECDITTFGAFLGMIPGSCDAANVFDACIGWSKRRCQKNGKDETCMNNVRTELGEFFNLIRFKEMHFKAIAERYKTYKMLFTRDESDDIFEYLLDYTSRAVYLCPKLKCIGIQKDTDNYIPKSIRFKISKRLLLDGITLSQTFVLPEDDEPIPFSADITVETDDEELVNMSANFTVSNLSFTFPQKVFIEAEVVYEIGVTVNLPNSSVYGYVFKRQEMDSVEFIPVKKNCDMDAQKVYWTGSEIRFIDIDEEEAPQ